MGSELRERDRTLAAIERALDQVRTGHGSAVFILGEAGLGKTSLLDHARSAAGAGGIEIGTGRGEQMERALPFGVLVQGLGELEAGDVVDVLTGVAPVSSPPLPFTARCAGSGNGGHARCSSPSTTSSGQTPTRSPSSPSSSGASTSSRSPSSAPCARGRRRPTTASASWSRRAPPPWSV